MLSPPHAKGPDKLTGDCDVLRLPAVSAGKGGHPDEPCPAKEPRQEVRHVFFRDAAFA